VGYAVWYGKCGLICMRHGMRRGMGTSMRYEYDQFESERLFRYSPQQVVADRFLYLCFVFCLSFCILYLCLPKGSSGRRVGDCE